MLSANPIPWLQYSAQHGYGRAPLVAGGYEDLTPSHEDTKPECCLLRGLEVLCAETPGFLERGEIMVRLALDEA